MNATTRRKHDSGSADNTYTVYVTYQRVIAACVVEKHVIKRAAEPGENPMLLQTKLVNVIYFLATGRSLAQGELKKSPQIKISVFHGRLIKYPKEQNN